VRYLSLRINYRFPLYHVYYQFSGAIAFGNVCPWLNGPSVLLHRNTVAINSTLKSITLTHCEYYSVHHVPLAIVQNSINNVTLIGMHKHIVKWNINWFLPYLIKISISFFFNLNYWIRLLTIISTETLQVCLRAILNNYNLFVCYNLIYVK